MQGSGCIADCAFLPPAHHRAGGPRQVWIQILRKSPFKWIITLINAGIRMHCWLCRPSPRPPPCWRLSSSLDSTSGGATLSTQRCEAESCTDKKKLNPEGSGCKVIYDSRPPHIWPNICAFHQIQYWEALSRTLYFATAPIWISSYLCPFQRLQHIYSTMGNPIPCRVDLNSMPESTLSTSKGLLDLASRLRSFLRMCQSLYF